MDVSFTWKMSGSFVGLCVRPVTSLLMVAFAVIASGTGMPNGQVVSARVAVVLVVVPLVGIGRIVAIGPWGGRDAWRGCRIVVIVASSSTAAVRVVASSSIITSAATIVGCIIV